jgi:uncharacterized protein (DUF2141 family)
MGQKMKFNPAMMNKSVTILIGLMMITNLAFSQFRLDIEITEIQNNKGYIMLQLFNSKEEIVAQEKLTIKPGLSVSFKDLKPGKYAVRYYHDENMNGKMETNLVGKPTEGYGFSNNVTGKYGPPPFEKWLFEVVEDKKIILKPTY